MDKQQAPLPNPMDIIKNIRDLPTFSNIMDCWRTLYDHPDNERVDGERQIIAPTGKFEPKHLISILKQHGILVDRGRSGKRSSKIWAIVPPPDDQAISKVEPLAPERVDITPAAIKAFILDMDSDLECFDRIKVLRKQGQTHHRVIMTFKQQAESQKDRGFSLLINDVSIELRISNDQVRKSLEIAILSLSTRMARNYRPTTDYAENARIMREKIDDIIEERNKSLRAVGLDPETLIRFVKDGTLDINVEAVRSELEEISEKKQIIEAQIKETRDQIDQLTREHAKLDKELETLQDRENMRKATLEMVED